MNGVYLLLGSNLNDRLWNLKTAVRALQKKIRILDESSIYETEPWGESDQSWFLNAILHIETSLLPADLLDLCLKTEDMMGRVRTQKWGARVIDIDILYYDNLVVNEPKLVLPHPGIPDRKFTLIPLCELCPESVHPVLKQTQAELLANCTDTLDCNLTEFELSI